MCGCVCVRACVCVWACVCGHVRKYGRHCHDYVFVCVCVCVCGDAVPRMMYIDRSEDAHDMDADMASSYTSK